MANILIVDDIPANIQLLIELLTPQGHTLRPTTNPNFALNSAITATPDLILLDINMTIMSGFELCRLLKQEPPPLSDVPIIFISARNDIESIIEGFKVGGVDYISKPFNGGEVLARIEMQLQLQQQKTQIKELHQKEIDQLTKMNQLKDEVLRIASHDLRGPLAVIRACGELLLDREGHLSPEGQEFVSHILMSVGDMDAYLRDLLDTVHANGALKLEFTTVDTSEYITAIVQKFKSRAEQKNLTLNFVLEPGDPFYISIDLRRFEQVIQNLLSNAIKYTPDGGTVTVSVGRHGGEIMVCIRDTGIGIPADSISHLFDQFYRVDEHRHLREQGTGLGLAIAKVLTERNHGRITVESKEDEGSAFMVFLPAQLTP